MSANPLFNIGSTPRVNCCVCGVEFGSPVLSERMKDKKSFYCPNGHVQNFIGESDAVKAARLANELSQQKAQTWAQRSRADKAEQRVRMFSAGKCPCCKQTFRRLREHMKREHPQFKA